MRDDAWRSFVRERDREAVMPRFAIRNVAKAWAETLTSVFSGPTVHSSHESMAAKPN
jgi:hypothetical protein